MEKEGEEKEDRKIGASSWNSGRLAGVLGARVRAFIFAGSSEGERRLCVQSGSSTGIF